MTVAPFAQVAADIGSFGRFQVQLLILLSVPNLLTAFCMFTQVFMVLDEAHHCSVAWVKHRTLTLSAAEQPVLSVPVDAAGSPEPCLPFRPPPTVPAWRTSSATASVRHSLARWAGSILQEAPLPKE